MIQQHIYTRCNRGLFMHGAGYDTAAKSDGLPEQLLQSLMLRAMCQYPETGARHRSAPTDSPVILLHCANEEAEALGIAQIPTAVYGGNAGRRITFMHQYIACGGEALPFADPQKTLLGAEFRSCYDEQREGGVLPALEVLPAKEYTALTSLRDVIAPVKEDFIAILRDVLWVLEGDDRTLVFPMDGSPASISTLARRRLAGILCALPPGLRNRLTFCSYWPNLDMASYCRVICTAADTFDRSQTGEHIRIAGEGSFLADPKSTRGYLEQVWQYADNVKLITDLANVLDGALWHSAGQGDLESLLNVELRLRMNRRDILFPLELQESIAYLGAHAKRNLFEQEKCAALMDMILAALPRYLSSSILNDLSTCVLAMEQSAHPGFAALLRRGNVVTGGIGE